MGARRRRGRERVRPLLRYGGLLWAAALLIASLCILRHELHALSYHEVVRSLEAMPTRALLLAIGLTLARFASLGALTSGGSQRAAG